MNAFLFYFFALATLAAANDGSTGNNCQQACAAFVQLTTTCSDVSGSVSGSRAGSDGPESPLSKQLQCLCSLNDYDSLTSCLACLRSSGQGDAFADEITRLQDHCRSAASSHEPPELHEL
ncbi:hypothetical protein PG996_007294 [Apiospora saccharicola]|uniref:Uncharacterized protein n=1 Tax=Apiospora saccharicola TaxID=335842 RepID=A0ABR1VBA4_9PEZI